MSAVDAVTEHLDGRASYELRAAVPIADLRRLGAFFTGERIARQMIDYASDPSDWPSIVDPACGCGDLLVAAAWHLPVSPGLEETLARWGEQLHGIDRVAEFVDVARQRLLLLALRRGARPLVRGRIDLPALLPGLQVGDGLDHEGASGARLFLLNPPYGLIPAPSDYASGAGLTSEAALWVDALVTTMREGSRLIALLPEVLRSGSRYARWRDYVATHLDVAYVQSVGQFDALTDVDVFILTADRSSEPRRCGPSDRAGKSSRRRMHGHGRTGRRSTRSPYRTERSVHHDEGASARQLHRPTRQRRYAKRLFKPPFVVVRRTSRPTTNGPRLRPVVVVGDEPVAVENHLLVLVPHRPTAAACRRLARRPA